MVLHRHMRAQCVGIAVARSKEQHVTAQLNIARIHFTHRCGQSTCVGMITFQIMQIMIKCMKGSCGKNRALILHK